MSAPRTAFERNYDDQHDPWLGVDLDPLGVGTQVERRCPVRELVGGKARTCRKPVPCPKHDAPDDYEPEPDERYDR